MRGPRVYPAVLVAVALALGGCGESPEGPTLAPPATPRTIELDWRATISVTTRSRIASRLDQRSVGLVLLETQTPAEVRRLTDNLSHPPPALKPTRTSPVPPPALGPGASWSATVSGPEELREGSVVRVLFGPFSSIERFRSEAQDVLWVTDHAVRL